MGLYYSTTTKGLDNQTTRRGTNSKVRLQPHFGNADIADVLALGLSVVAMMLGFATGLMAIASPF